MFILVTHADGDQRGTQGKILRRLTAPTGTAANLAIRAGGGGNNSDHILTAKRHDRGRPFLVRPSFPAETRSSASGTPSI
jgi:hypothetical protein